MTPRSPGTKPEKKKNFEDLVRKLPNRFIQSEGKLTTRAHMQMAEDSRRLGNRHRAKEATGWAEVVPGRPAQPISWPSQPPFDLAAIRAIYSSEARRHAFTDSPSTVEEKRREGHHLGEERVELVD
jgi:hypothetical protein